MWGSSNRPAKASGRPFQSHPFHARNQASALPLETARDFMETIPGFPTPADTNNELGISLLGPGELSESVLPQGRIFQETRTTVGRREEIASLVDFASARGPLRVAVVTGRAGMGKTSLLLALAEALSAQRVGIMLQLAIDIPQNAATAPPRIPPGPSLIVVDDAHLKAAPKALLGLAKERRDVRFVFTTRPSGIARLSALFSQTGLSSDRIKILPELSPLGTSDAEAASAEALGEDKRDLAPKLAAASEGHPFVLSLAGRLLREDMLHPIALERSTTKLAGQSFAAQTIERAYEIVLLKAAAAVDQNLLRAVLALIAALAPVRTSDERFLQSAGELLGCRRRELVSALRALENLGVVDRGPHGVRVVPDALADHVLYNALKPGVSSTPGTPNAPFAPFAPSIAATAQLFEERFGTPVLVPLLRNAGALDGPSLPETSPAASLCRDLFEQATSTIEAASPAERARLLAALRPLATDYPERLLELVTAVMRLSANKEKEPSSATSALAPPASVLYELPSILRRIGLQQALLPAVIDLLWELGRDDLRLQSPHPDHPMRVLRELASRANARPPGVHEALLDGVDRWLLTFDAHEHKHSPLDVLDTFLSDGAMDTSASDERRTDLRNQALATLCRAAASTNRAAALSGISGLERVLGDGSLEDSGSDPSWRDGERLRVLLMLRDAALQSKDPLVHFAVTDALRRAARRASADDVRAAAEQATNDVPSSAERRLFEALTQRTSTQRVALDLPQSEMAPSEGDFRNAASRIGRPGGENESNERRGVDACRAVVDEILALGTTPEVMAADIGGALEALSLANKSGSPRLLLHVLSRKHPAFARATCETIMREPDGPLGPHIASLLHALRESSPETASELVLAIVSAGNPTLSASIAQVFHRWVDKPIPADNEALRKLLLHRDSFVRRAALGALRTLAKSAPRDALDLAVGVDLSDGPEVAEALFGALDAGGLFTESALSEEEIILFLSRLGVARSLDGHSTMRFLAHAGKRLPEEVALLMVDRITQAAGAAAGGVLGSAGTYEPLPPEGLARVLASLPATAGWLSILRRIRHLAKARTGWVRFHAARLFHDASHAYAPATVEVLSEWVEAGNAEELEAISALLEEAPATFLFSHLDLIATLLRRAAQASDACFERVRSALFSVATGQARPRAGRAEIDEAELRRAAREASLRLTPRSPEQRFFEAITKHADARLAEEHAADDDEFFDL